LVRSVEAVLLSADDWDTLETTVVSRWRLRVTLAMKRIVAAVCLVLVASGGFAATTSPLYAAAQALETRASIPELPGPAASLAEMWQKTPIVVVGTVSQVGPPVASTRGVVVYRLCSVIVEEHLKTPASIAIGGTMTVFQPGGTARVGNVEYRTSFITEPLVEGDRMVLFLQPSTEVGMETFIVRIAGGDAFRWKDGDELVALGTSRHLDELKDRSTLEVAELLALLRSLR
jgi:hypothetical protein